MATQRRIAVLLPRQLAEITGFQGQFGSFGRIPKSPEPYAGFRIRFHPFSSEPNCF
jgi:hypothetical protein